MKQQLIRFKKTANGRVTVVRCHNLRPGKRPGSLVPVDSPTTVATAVRRPLTFITTSDAISHAIVETHDGRIAFISGIDPAKPTSLAKPPRILFTPTAHVHGALAADDDVTLFTDNGPVKLYYCPGESTPWLLSTDMPQIPGIALTVADTVTIEAQVPGCTLSGLYSQQNRQLTTSDASRVDKMLAEAYNVLSDRARAADMLFQPVMASYSLFDRANRLIYRSAPVLLQSSAGQQLSGSFEMRISDNNLSGCTLSAQGFRVALSVTADLPRRWADIVNRAVINISPQIHPFNSARPALHTIAYSSQSGLTLRASLPGYNSGISASDISTSRYLLSRLVASFDTVARNYHTVRDPFGGNPALSSPSPLFLGSPRALADEVATISTLINRPIENSFNGSIDKNLSSIHHSTSVCRCGPTAFYANPSFTTFPGFNPADHVVAVDPAHAWEAFVKVVLANGSEIAVSHSRGDACAPLAISPVVMYPSPKAVSLTFTVRTSSDVRTVVVPLTPIEGAGIAVGFSNDFRPIQLSSVAGGEFVIPDAVPVTRTLHGYAAVGDAASPGVCGSVVRVSAHPVAAIIPAPSPSGAWDYGRSRAYAFSAEGCSLVVAEKTRESIAAGIILQADLSDPALIAPAKECVYVAVPSENAIYSIAGRTVRYVASIPESTPPIAAIMRDGLHNHLWCIPAPPPSPAPDGADTVVATIITLDNPAEGFTATIAPVAAVFREVEGCDSLAWLSSRALTDFSSSAPADDIECCWQAVVSPESITPTALSAVVLHASGTPSQCLLQISRSNIDGHAPSTANLLSAAITGTILGPLTIPVYAPPSTAPITVTLSATASSGDFTLTSIHII